MGKGLLFFIKKQAFQMVSYRKVVEGAEFLTNLDQEPFVHISLHENE